MFAATRRWINRNRTPLAIGAGIVGAGYVATQYVLSRINDARERMSSDRIAKENLRRRFEQNQEDCTFTVLALLPTATAAILEDMDTERITYEIQTMKGQKAAAGGATAAGGGETGGTAGKAEGGAAGNLSAPSIADTTLTEEDAKSSLAASSAQSESGVHASQITVPPAQQSPQQQQQQQEQQQQGTGGDAAQDGGAQQAQQQKSRKTKRQLWDDLTISSITRSFTLLYTLALLTMLTRVQLNLLGRRSYLSSVISLAAGSSAAHANSAPISLENNDDDAAPDHAVGNSSDFETNRKYLAFSWWLLNRGWHDLGARVERAVRDVFGHLSPRDLLSLERFSELTLEVRKRVEGGATPAERHKNNAAVWLGYLMPGRDREEEVIRESGILDEVESSTVDLGPSSSPAGAEGRASLRRLLDETSDLVESPAFTHVLTLLLDNGFSELVDQKVATTAFELPSQKQTGPQQGQADEVAQMESMLVGGAPLGTTLPAEEAAAQRSTKVVQLPRILSVLTRQAHMIGNGMPNEYLREMERVADLEGFAAVVYSSNWESEVMRDEAFAGSLADLNTKAAEDSPESGGSSQCGNGDKAAAAAAATAAAATARATGDESVVLVDPQQSFESAWGRALEKK